MDTTTKIVQQVKAARRVSAPLVAIQTPDPAATVNAIKVAIEEINASIPLVHWDIVRGVMGLNKAGDSAKNSVYEDETYNPLDLLAHAARLPEGVMVFVHMAHRFMTGNSSVDAQQFLQGVWNLRDHFKGKKQMLVMLGTTFKLPGELSNDVLLIDEPLPDAEQLAAIVREQYENGEVEIDEPTVALAVEAVQGLSAFTAEQVSAMSLTEQGMDVDALWERKRKMIEQTPGLKVHRGEEKFADIGGLDNLKTFLGRVIHGKSRPNAVVFIDEIEKAMAGASGDTSGVSQDQLGAILTWMQDHAATGCILVGPAGTGKSNIAKATGNEAGIPTITMDLGASKGSLVGASEENIRANLKTISAVSNGRSVWIATCNSITEIKPELRRRFGLGIFFMDLPDDAERKPIWEIWLGKYGLDASQERPEDTDWTGAEVKQCCDLAWRLDCTLVEASQYVVPVAKSAADSIERLRSLADGKFLHASKPGLYTRRQPAANALPTGKRKLQTQGA